MKINLEFDIENFALTFLFIIFILLLIICGVYNLGIKNAIGVVLLINAYSLLKEIFGRK